MKKKVMVVFGTRPEAIKMAPVIRALKHAPGVDTCVVATAQHRQMLDQVLELFDIVPDHDLDLMRPGQDLDSLFAKVLTAVGRVIGEERPDLVLVHGDTTTTLAAGLAAFHAGTPLGHVEAGLRTGNMQAPWPEEANRRLVAPLAALHFAPTERARGNLLGEGIPGDAIHVTGNTIVDALSWVTARIGSDAKLEQALASRFPFLGRGRKTILVTGHRRESQGAGFEQICSALMTLASREDVQIVYPVHPNPKVRGPVEALLGGRRNILLLEPLEYLPFVFLMSRADLILTDSGGVQEEAPAFATPVLVMRDTTERPEAVEAGKAWLVGTRTGDILGHANRLLDSATAPGDCRPGDNPFGDGASAGRIVRKVLLFLGVAGSV